MLDATGPLAWNGRLRGRAVVSGVDRKYFYDEGDLGRVAFYGVTELDLTPATLLSAGLHYSDEHAAPWPDNGLPDDVVAAPSGFPRDTSFILPWQYDNLSTDRKSTRLNSSH